ncbi:MAG: molecular chaperone DnaJ [Gaiellales bacterium]|nr:MAG: molecular chaperone DnaJ [Gaiellales bacterium]
MKRDYYEVLGVPRGADDKEIKKAFRTLARELHPDVNRHDPDAEAKFKEAAEAYEVLSDADSRAAYDRFGFDGLKQRGGFHDFSQFSFDDIIRSFFGEAMFGEDMFGGGRAASRGRDIAIPVELTLREAAAGVKRELEFEATVACEACGGTGAKPGTERATCTACNGAGRVRSVTRTAFGQFMQTGVCGACRGAGSVVEEACAACDGSGRTVAARKVSVEIPAGIADGQSIRMPGQGDLGAIGSAPGDLYVHVSVAPDEGLGRDGDDLIHHLKLTMVQAAVGHKAVIPTIEGDEEVDIRPGAQPGDVIVLKGRGMPRLRSRGRGELRLVVDVMVPHDLTQEQKELLREFEETTSDKNYAGGQGGLFNRIRAAFK